jgi:hypothetical protein
MRINGGGEPGRAPTEGQPGTRARRTELPDITDEGPRSAENLRSTATSRSQTKGRRTKPPDRPPAVWGYHGTSKENAQAILVGGPASFGVSRNDYDWLGDGRYFWEMGRRRAWEWARAKYRDDAAVIGAAIRLERCMNFGDSGWDARLKQAYEDLRNVAEAAGRPLRSNRGKQHFLDRAVINFCIQRLFDANMPIYVVRAPFAEDGPIFGDESSASSLSSRGHVQLAVINWRVIERLWEDTEPSGIDG